MSVVISVSHLSKLYRLGAIGAGTLRGDFERWWARMRGRPDPLALVDHEGPSAGFRNSKSDIRNGEIWALRDVSFEVQQGEILGIIGRNGAGKSTLLKILSQVTAPTEGCVKIRGRVASLLEVGTGFHPELTGRENIYLNGAILGMKRAEIDRKFDEIVAFAEVERFIDTPVKRYSSGMYVRLAFAVAAHLEPEILIIDEVLAVGDAAFQRKCLGKMGDVATQGRTVLFVSHNMAAIMNLCTRSILLHAGCAVATGSNETIVRQYLSSEQTAAMEIDLHHRVDRRGSGKLRFSSMAFKDAAGRTASHLTAGETAVFVLGVENNAGRAVENAEIAIGIDDQLGSRITHLSSEVANGSLGRLGGGLRLVEVVIPKLPLVTGRYRVTLFMSLGGEIADWILDAASFDVETGDFFGTGRLPPPSQGNFLLNHQFVVRES